MTNVAPETNSSPLKIGRAPQGNSSFNHRFLGAMLVSGRVTTSKIMGIYQQPPRSYLPFLSLILRNRLRNLSSSFLQLIPSQGRPSCSRGVGLLKRMNSCPEKTGISRGNHGDLYILYDPCLGKYRPNLGFQKAFCYCGCPRFFVA